MNSHNACSPFFHHPSWQQPLIWINAFSIVGRRLARSQMHQYICPLHEDPNVHVCAVSQRLFAVPHGANAQTRAETKLPSNPVALAAVERQLFAKSVNAPEKVIAGKRETTRRSLTLFAYILFSERSSVASARGPVRR